MNCAAFDLDEPTWTVTLPVTVPAGTVTVRAVELAELTEAEVEPLAVENTTLSKLAVVE